MIESGVLVDTGPAIHEHLELLREMAPTWASFYVLCPIPGTEQYDDFMAQGLITETNLDRFDTTCLTGATLTSARAIVGVVVRMLRPLLFVAARAAECQG